MYARIIPALRTPRGINAFDYEIPEGMEIVRGDLVWIPFRSSKAVGIVDALLKTVEHEGAIKSLIGRYATIHLSSKTVDLLHDLAEHSSSSLPAIAHAWLGTLPKRPKASRSPFVKSTSGDTLVGESVSRSEQMHFENLPTYRLTDLPTLLTNHLHAEHGVIATAKQKIREKKKTLILTPWSGRAHMIANMFDTDALTSDCAAGKRFRLWREFLSGETPILIATRIGAWLCPEADCIILDEPENDDHKQDELSPRYDARWIVEEAAKKGVEVVQIGLTPRLRDVAEESRLVGKSVSRSVEITHRLTDLPTNRLPTIPADIAYVDIHRKDWSDIQSLQNRTLNEIEEAHSDGRQLFIIHPIHGERAGLRCADCRWQVTCERCGAMPTLAQGKLHCRRCGFAQDALISCPSCGGLNLSFTRPGRDHLAMQLSKQGMRATMLSIGEWQELMDIPKNSLIVLTDLSLFSGACEDLRRRERLIIAWRRLVDICASANAHLIVQADPDLLNHAREWLTCDGCLKTLQSEVEERKRFGYPPSTQLIKIIFRGSKEQADACLDQMRKLRAQDHTIAINGPFEVQFRPSHRGARWIGHVISPKERPILSDNPILTLAKESQAIIDLDPIAFFE